MKTITLFIVILCSSSSSLVAQSKQFSRLFGDVIEHEKLEPSIVVDTVHLYRSPSMKLQLTYDRNHLLTEYDFISKKKYRTLFNLFYNKNGYLDSVRRIEPYKETIYYFRDTAGFYVTSIKSSNKNDSIYFAYNSDTLVSHVVIGRDTIRYLYENGEIKAVEGNKRITKKLDTWLYEPNNFERLASEYWYADTLIADSIALFQNGLKYPVTVLSFTHSRDHVEFMQKRITSVYPLDFDFNKFDFLKTRCLLANNEADIKITTDISVLPVFSLQNEEDVLVAGSLDVMAKLNYKCNRPLLIGDYVTISGRMNLTTSPLQLQSNFDLLNLTLADRLYLYQSNIGQFRFHINGLSYLTKGIKYELNGGVTYNLSRIAIKQPNTKTTYFSVSYYAQLLATLRVQKYDVILSAKLLSQLHAFNDQTRRYSDTYFIPEASVSRSFGSINVMSKAEYFYGLNANPEESYSFLLVKVGVGLLVKNIVAGIFNRTRTPIQH